MRKRLQILLVLVAASVVGMITSSGKIGPASVSAQAVTAPDAYELPNPTGIDHVFIFKDLTDAVIKTQANIDKLYRMNGADSVFAYSGMDKWVNMEDNTGYIVYAGGVRETFWVIDYSNYKLEFNALNADIDYTERCTETKLILDGNLPELSYRTQYGSKQIISRECEVSYTTLSWGGEDWQDSLCTETMPLRETLIAGAPLRDTEFTLRADQIAKALGLEQDSVVSDVYEACAVAAHPTTITTIRGTEAENMRTNEVERPTEATQLKGSAPLDILFKANGNTPVAQYYKWQILKGNDLIAQRSDESHRYVFDDFGEFRVLLWVSNDKCQSDSVEITVSVSTSQLVVPNVFTPNGDGRNDEFRVMYRSIIEFECWIYNRWGKLVYHWTDPAKGWDGTINGRPAAEGAYYYVIRAKGADAEADGKYHRVTTKRPADVGVYQLSGDINLIRGTKK